MGKNNKKPNLADKSENVPGRNPANQLRDSLPESNIYSTEITYEANKLISSSNQNLFIVQPINKWLEQAKNEPIPQMLFDILWFENELCILFASTNQGKSIIAVQIADSISSGRPIPGLRLDAHQQKVLYLDFELTKKQLEARYTINYENANKFNNGFFRAEINLDAMLLAQPKDFDAILNIALEQTIEYVDAKVIIIDNLTYLKTGTENAKDALPLMKHLRRLKNTYGLSILVLAHTPKRNPFSPITRNDLQGSSMLMNFCDSSFAIGESQKGSNIKYIKQIKVRNAEYLYDSENVIECQIIKPDNFLKFEITGYGDESDHLKQLSQEEVQLLEDQIIAMKKLNPQLSDREIGRKLNTNHKKVARTLKRHQKNQHG